MAPFVQGACCTVISAKRKSDEQALSIKVSLKKPNLFFHYFIRAIPCKRVSTILEEKMRKESPKTS